jgi:hypothetical protein
MHYIGKEDDRLNRMIFYQGTKYYLNSTVPKVYEHSKNEYGLEGKDFFILMAKVNIGSFDLRVVL